MKSFIQLSYWNLRTRKSLALIMFSSSLILSACGGGGGGSDDGGGNTPPTASNSAPVSNAGTDQTLTLGDSINLDGSGSSDPDNDTLNYQWSMDSQPAGSTTSFSDATSVSSAITLDTAGTYVIQLTVNDGSLSNSDTLTITVNEVTQTNTAPDSNAGSDQTVNLGDTINLDGSASSDSDGDTLSYNWIIDSQPNGASGSFSNATAASPDLVVDTAGTYVIQLVVNDGVLSDTDTLTLTVNDNSTSNSAPTSNAGSDQVVEFGETINLDGSASSDSDGDALTYVWTIDTQPTGSSPSFDDSQSVTPLFTVDTSGTYVLRLVVSDGELTSADTLSITVNPMVNTQPAIAAFEATPSSSDSATPIVFTWDISDADGDDLTCAIDVNDDGTSEYSIVGCTSSSSQSHTYSVGGDYTARLTISDGEGGEAQQTVTIAINNPPTIDSFSLAPDPAYVNSTATFSWAVNDPDSDTLVCYLDIDNDGTDDYTVNDCASTTSQTHVYTEVGDYTAKLTLDDTKADVVVQTLDFTVIESLSARVTASGPAVAGEKILYSITISNINTQSIDGVTVSAVVPSELSFDATTDSIPDASGCSGSCTSGEVSSWSIGTLEAGESQTIIVNATVDGAASDTTIITLPVTLNSTEIDDILVEKSIEVFNSPAVDIAFSSSADPVMPDQTFSYQLDLGNIGGTSLTNTELRAYLPENVSIVTISDGGIEESPGVILWDEGSLADGTVLKRSVEVTANSVLISGEILAASAELTHDGGLAVDNTAEYDLTVVETAVPFSVNISASANPVLSDERLLYTISIGNTSTLAVDDVLVEFITPTELSFDATTDAEPDVAGCITDCSGGSWSVGTLAAGENQTITVNAEVDTLTSGDLIVMPIRVTATGLDDVIDLRKTVGVYNTLAADVAVSTSVDPVVPGETFSYQLDFGNISAGNLTNTELRAYLPAGVSVLSISDGGIEESTGVVVWDEGAEVIAATKTRQISVQADSVTAGETLTLLAQLNHDGVLEVDSSTEYDLSVSDPSSDISVAIVADQSSVEADDMLAYTITVSNDSSVAVDDVSVLFRVPAELSFDASSDATPGASGCSPSCSAGQEASWSLGTLAAGASQDIVINATVVSGVANGNLIVAPVRVTATDIQDTINLQHVTPVKSSIVVGQVPVIPDSTTDVCNLENCVLASVAKGEVGYITLAYMNLSSVEPVVPKQS